jgi:hypothetical protein
MGGLQRSKKRIFLKVDAARAFLSAAAFVCYGRAWRVGCAPPCTCGRQCPGHWTNPEHSIYVIHGEKTLPRNPNSSRSPTRDGVPALVSARDDGDGIREGLCSQPFYSVGRCPVPAGNPAPLASSTTACAASCVDRDKVWAVGIRVRDTRRFGPVARSVVLSSFFETASLQVAV